MVNSVIPFPAAARAKLPRESETDEDELGCARGVINATPIALILWGVIIGFCMWVL
jgi:hypothetical protein